MTAAAVVLATGAHQCPNVPALAAELDPGICQLHSSAYRNPGGLPPGPALVVGAGNSGAEIALELARAGRATVLAGRDTGKLPAWLLNRVYWWLMSDVITLERHVGRRVLGKFRTGGSPLIRNTPATLRAAGIDRGGRVTAVAGGMPVLEDGRRLEVASVVWATGFTPDYSLIDFPIATMDGYPVHERGVVPGEPGLYLLGIPMLHALTSSFLGGVGRDAAYLADRITERHRRPAPTPRPPHLVQS